MCQPYAACRSPAASQMFGDQRRVLLDRLRRALLDRGGQAPVPLGAIGFQL